MKVLSPASEAGRDFHRRHDWWRYYFAGDAINIANGRRQIRPSILYDISCPLGASPYAEHLALDAAKFRCRSAAEICSRRHYADTCASLLWWRTHLKSKARHYRAKAVEIKPPLQCFRMKRPPSVSRIRYGVATMKSNNIGAAMSSPRGRYYRKLPIIRRS